MRAYPNEGGARDRWILERRPAKRPLDARQAYGAFVEDEAAEALREGGVVPVAAVATILLTNRECPWRCLMCDLFENTLDETVPRGALAEQIRNALGGLPPARRIKLYNAGSFFDPRAIPPEELPGIAALVRAFEVTTVESHPALVGDACLGFRDLLSGARLEVAMGLETVHPEVLERLNKRMTLESFRRATARLVSEGIGVRAFVLVGLPFLDARESLAATKRSITWAFDAGVTTVSLVPLRDGNGAMEALAETGEYVPPSLSMIEESASFGLDVRRGRVLVDLWDLERFGRCATCFGVRAERLAAVNVTQRLPGGPTSRPCLECGWSA